MDRFPVRTPEHHELNPVAHVAKAVALPDGNIVPVVHCLGPRAEDVEP